MGFPGSKKPPGRTARCDLRGYNQCSSLHLANMRSKLHYSLAGGLPAGKSCVHSLFSASCRNGNSGANRSPDFWYRCNLGKLRPVKEVIPAKAGIQSADGAFPRVCRVDSRFRGNDWGLQRPCLPDDTATRLLTGSPNFAKISRVETFPNGTCE